MRYQMVTGWKKSTLTIKRLQEYLEVIIRTGNTRSITTERVEKSTLFFNTGVKNENITTGLQEGRF